MRVDGLAAGAAYTLTQEGVDAEHSTSTPNTPRRRHLGRAPDDDQAWPTEEQWEALRAADRLEELAPATTVTADEHGTVTVEVTLQMPSMAFLRLVPAAG